MEIATAKKGSEEVFDSKMRDNFTLGEEALSNMMKHEVSTETVLAW